MCSQITGYSEKTRRDKVSDDKTGNNVRCIHENNLSYSVNKL